MSRLQTKLTAMAGAAIVLSVLMVGRSAYGDEAAAQQRLIGRELTKLRGHWICREEMKLRRQLKVLPQLERRFLVAREEVRAMRAEYDGYQEQLKQLREAVEQNRQRLVQKNLDPLARKRFENEMRRHVATVSNILAKIRKKLNGQDEGSPLTEAMVRLVNARSALALALLAIDRHTRGMTEQYAKLGEDKEIARELRAAGPHERLGPAEPYEVQERRRLEQLSEAVFSDHMPVYRRGNRYRLSVIVGDQTPATFSYLDSQTRTMIPSTLAQAAGIELDEDSPPAILLLANINRKIRVHRVTIRKLRIGKYVLENVPALAFDPEGEDLGAILGRDALAEYRAELDPRRLDFHMTPLD